MSAPAAFRRTLQLTSTRFSRLPTSTTFTSATRTAATPVFRSAPRLPSGSAHARAFSATMSKEGVHNLTSKADFDTAIGTKDTLMVLDCFATWCGPCKVIAPQVVKFSDEFKDARFYKLDVDEVPEVAQELAVRAMPTFLLFKNGEKVGEVVGANPTALKTAIQQNV